MGTSQKQMVIVIDPNHAYKTIEFEVKKSL